MRRQHARQPVRQQRAEAGDRPAEHRRQRHPDGVAAGKVDAPPSRVPERDVAELVRHYACQLLGLHLPGPEPFVEAAGQENPPVRRRQPVHHRNLVEMHLEPRHAEGPRQPVEHRR
jgi:hypothetical protein